MTEFVESFTTRNMLTPWATSRARSWLFIAPIDHDRTQEYLDHFMNSEGPDLSPYHYEVWSEPCFGFLTLVDHRDFSRRVDNESDDDEDTRHLSHQELIWTFPAARYRRTDDNLLVEKTLVWIQPFYFDSNSFVTFSSREIWGGEKGMADIKIAKGSTARDFHMDVALNGFSTYNPRSHVHAIGGVHIRGGPMVPNTIKPGDAIHCSNAKKRKKSRKHAIPKMVADEKRVLDSSHGPKIPSLDRVIKSDKKLLAFLASFQQLMHKDWNADNPTHHFFVPDITVNTLKQYRDAFSIERAAYRAIIESVVKHDNVVDYGYLPRRRIDVRFMWSDSFKEQLRMLLNLEDPGKDTQWGHVGQGLPINDAGIDWNLPAVRLDVRLALYFESDATFEVKKVLHTYGQGPQYPHPEPMEG